MSDEIREKDIQEIDFKALFEKEFETENITVSEELIARTMAAIKAQEVGETSEKSETPENPSITSVKDRRKFSRLAISIAAALVIGVVGLTLLMNGGFHKKSESMDNSMKMETAASIQRYDNESERATSDSKVEEESDLPEETKENYTQENNLKIDEVKTESSDKGEMSFEKNDDLKDITNTFGGAVDSNGSIQKKEEEISFEATESVDATTKDDKEENPGLYISDKTDLMIQRYIKENAADTEKDDIAKPEDPEIFRSYDEYSEIKSLGAYALNDLEKILTECKDSEEVKKYLVKLLIDDISKDIKP